MWKFWQHSPANEWAITSQRTQVPIEIYGYLYFSQNWEAETSWNFTHSFNCQNIGFSNYNVSINQHFSKCTPSLKFKCYFFSLKVLWSIDHQDVLQFTIVSCTIRMVNEAWLFTIYHWTHGCDINVVKNYLNGWTELQVGHI